MIILTTYLKKKTYNKKKKTYVRVIPVHKLPVLKGESKGQVYTLGLQNLPNFCVFHFLSIVHIYNKEIKFKLNSHQKM